MCIPAPAPFVEIVKFDGSPQTPCVRPGPYAVTYPLLSESTWNLNGEPVQTYTMNMLYHVGSFLLYTIQVHKWQVIMFLRINSSHNLYTHYCQFLFCQENDFHLSSLHSFDATDIFSSLFSFSPHDWTNWVYWHGIFYPECIGSGVFWIRGLYEYVTWSTMPNSYCPALSL